MKNTEKNIIEKEFLKETCKKHEYKFEKKTFDKKDINYLRVFFDNSDYIQIQGEEIVDIFLKLYDRLIVENKGCYPVAESGFVKIKLSDKPKRYDFDAFVYNPKVYKSDLKSYIENRLCNEGGIKCLHIHDENNWHDAVYGDMTAKMEGEYLIITVIKKSIPTPTGSKEHNVYLHNITKKVIRSIELDVENCEGFTVYVSEIIDMRLSFNKSLRWGASAYYREIESGYIVLSIDGNIYNRHNSLFKCDEKNVLPSKKELEKRLLGIHDICHLYITYNACGFEYLRKECIEIDDIREEEELSNDDYDSSPYFQGGYCTRQKDKTLLITFGKQAKALQANDA